MRRLALFVLVTGLLLPSAALAGGYVGTPNPVVGAPGPLIPKPTQVPGKEFTNAPDYDDQEAPVAAPTQSLAWDGLGGTLNSLVYGPTLPSALERQQVDAQAFLGTNPFPGNPNDHLFDSVVKDQSALIFSVSKSAVIYSEAISTGSPAVWATPLQIDASPTGAPDVADLDSLEVWGSDHDPTFGGDNGFAFSLFGDPLDLVSGFRVAVWNSVGGAGPAVPVFTTFDIALAITGNPSLAADLEPFIDVDAMMLGPWGGPVGAALRPAILFSIAPTGPLGSPFPAAGYDGGEIWFWDGFTPGGASFLFHGGHLWDTAFNVMGTFDVGSENVDALEAVSEIPEPSTLLLVGLGGLALAAARRRRRSA